MKRISNLGIRLPLMGVTASRQLQPRRLLPSYLQHQKQIRRQMASLNAVSAICHFRFIRSHVVPFRNYSGWMPRVDNDTRDYSTIPKLSYYIHVSVQRSKTPQLSELFYCNYISNVWTEGITELKSRKGSKEEKKRKVRTASIHQSQSHLWRVVERLWLLFSDPV